MLLLTNMLCSRYSCVRLNQSRVMLSVQWEPLLNTVFGKINHCNRVIAVGDECVKSGTGNILKVFLTLMGPVYELFDEIL